MTQWLERKNEGTEWFHLEIDRGDGWVPRGGHETKALAEREFERLTQFYGKRLKARIMTTPRIVWEKI